MIELTYFLLIIQLSSYLYINFLLFLRGKITGYQRWIKIYFAFSFIIYLSSIVSSFLLNTSYPVFHFGLPILNFIILKSINSDHNYKVLFLISIIAGALIFLFESIIGQQWMNNNEYYTLFHNLSTIILSFLTLTFHSNKARENFRNELFVFTSIIFFTAASRLVIGLYESSFRETLNNGTFLLLYTYLFLEIIQNIGFSIFIYKWKRK